MILFRGFDRRLPAALLAGVILSVAAAGAARAQLMSTNSTSFNAGYGRTAGEENRPVDFSLRDAHGNLTIIDGVMSTGSDQSTLSGGTITDGGGYAGVGGLYNSPSAIGNNLTVVTQGNYNTVIVNSTQTNNGAVTATGTINNGVGAGGN